jgi:hypothetical protein
MCIVCLTVSVAAVVVSLGVSGCAKKPTQTVEHQAEYGELSKLNLPNWVLSPYYDLPSEVIAGVGISKAPSPNDQLKFLLIQAESTARAEIATSLQTEISRLTKDAMQSASIDSINAVENSFATVTTEIVKNVPLNGAVRDKIFQDKNGIVYVRMIIKSSIVKEYLKSNIDNYSEAMRQAGVTRKSIQDTNASLKHLFDELDLKTNTKQTPLVNE